VTTTSFPWGGSAHPRGPTLVHEPHSGERAGGRNVSTRHRTAPRFASSITNCITYDLNGEGKINRGRVYVLVNTFLEQIGEGRSA
jgi:hypothetical protein